MFVNSLLTPDRTARLLTKSMDMCTLQAEVISSNLANMDTPGYKAREIDFREALAREAGRERPAGGAMRMERTNPGHMSSSGSVDGVDIEIIKDNPGRVDGNTVDMDAELYKLAETQIMYNFALTAYSKKMGIVQYAILNARV